MNSFDISVIICTYNRAEYLLNALYSLIHQTAKPTTFEVIVVNNASTDNTDELMAEFLETPRPIRIEYLVEYKQGSSFARNSGARIARGKYFCFMDDDAEAAPDYIDNIKAFFQIHPEVAVLGGKIIPKYVPSEPKWMSYYVSALVGNFHYADEAKPFSPGHYPLESNVTFEANIFRQVQGFPEHLPGVVGTTRIGGEGKDLVLRITALGRQAFYEPNAMVHHVVEVKKLTPSYMANVAKGIGAGERMRIHMIGKPAPIWKLIEYCFKLLAAIGLGTMYTLKGKPEQAWPVIAYRTNAIHGFLQQKVPKSPR